jgi:imidazolonepropionase-like amidohydrolase
MHRTLLALLTLSCSLSAADKTYVLKAAHMFDGKSDHVVSPGLVVVTNGKITAVGAKAAFPAGTSLDAELLGVADRTGSLEAGKLADIVACPGNPEENIRQVENIRFVMKDGVVYRKSGD